MYTQYKIDTATAIAILTEGSSRTSLLEAHNSNLLKLGSTGLMLILCKKHWKSELSKSNSPLDFADKFRSAIVRDWTEIMGTYFPGLGVEYTSGLVSVAVWKIDTDFLCFRLPGGDDWIDCSIYYEYGNSDHPSLNFTHYDDQIGVTKAWEEYQKFSDPFSVDHYSQGLPKGKPPFSKALPRQRNLVEMEIDDIFIGDYEVLRKGHLKKLP